MAFKVAIVCALFAFTSAVPVSPVTYAASPIATYLKRTVNAVASTHENIVSSFVGTVSAYPKSIQTPYFSVSRVDTRINNNADMPLAKHVFYGAPAIAYAAPTTGYSKAFLTAHVPAVKTGSVVYSSTVAADKPAIAYSPAATVSHVSFDGFGSNWTY